MDIQTEIQKISAEIDELNKTRVHYKLQSEWHRMMYALCLKMELLVKLQEENA
jgi:hypothetical protein